jgi:hypothetical protein
LAYVKTPLGQQRFLDGAAGAAADVSFLVASLWVICFAVIGVRVVISMPHMLRANWIFRMTEIRSVTAYLAAIRRSLWVLAVAPVWLLLCVFFLLRWPAWPIAGHLALLGLVGAIVVELSLYDFHKLPFTCSWLPGQSKVHAVFWGCLLVVVPLVAARFEERWLNTPLGYLCMFAFLAVIAVCARWRASASARLAEELVFEEEYPPEIFGLNLPRNADVALNRL